MSIINIFGNIDIMRNTIFRSSFFKFYFNFNIYKFLILSHIHVLYLNVENLLLLSTAGFLKRILHNNLHR